MVFNSKFNNISVICDCQIDRWVRGENHRTAAIDWQILSHNVVSSAPHQE